MANPKQEFYEGATFDTLEKLRKRCEVDEKQHTAKMKSLELATNDGKKGTLGTYERVPTLQMKVGLLFDEFNTEGEALQIEAKRMSEGHSPMYRTKVRIGADAKNIVVTRKKKA